MTMGITVKMILRKIVVSGGVNRVHAKHVTPANSRNTEKVAVVAREGGRIFMIGVRVRGWGGDYAEHRFTLSVCTLYNINTL